jgi:hypothetical protein
MFVQAPTDGDSWHGLTFLVRSVDPSLSLLGTHHLHVTSRSGVMMCLCFLMPHVTVCLLTETIALCPVTICTAASKKA